MIDEAATIERALRAALAKLAPVGGPTRLHVNSAAGALVALLGDLLAGTRPGPDEVERLVALFRERLVAGLAERSARRH